MADDMTEMIEDIQDMVSDVDIGDLAEEVVEDMRSRIEDTEFKDLHPFHPLVLLKVVGEIGEVSPREMAAALKVVRENESVYITLDGSDDLNNAVRLLEEGVVMEVTPELRKWYLDHGKPLAKNETDIIIPFTDMFESMDDDTVTDETAETD